MQLLCQWGRFHIYMMSAVGGAGEEGVPKKQTKGTKSADLWQWQGGSKNPIWKPPVSYFKCASSLSDNHCSISTEFLQLGNEAPRLLWEALRPLCRQRRDLDGAGQVHPQRHLRHHRWLEERNLHHRHRQDWQCELQYYVLLQLVTVTLYPVPLY